MFAVGRPLTHLPVIFAMAPTIIETPLNEGDLKVYSLCVDGDS